MGREWVRILWRTAEWVAGNGLELCGGRPSGWQWLRADSQATCIVLSIVATRQCPLNTFKGARQAALAAQNTHHGLKAYYTNYLLLIAHRRQNAPSSHSPRKFCSVKAPKTPNQQAPPILEAIQDWVPMRPLDTVLINQYTTLLFVYSS